MEKKIGILTVYYKTINYGAMLQAYALVKCLNNMGYSAEQITYDRFRDSDDVFEVLDSVGQPSRISQLLQTIKSNGILYPAKYYFHKKKAFDISVREEIRKRYRSIERFGNNIPHSAEIYTYDNISNSLADYDTYVVGSDQVWSPFLYRRAFFCDFVGSSEMNCIAYAVSISQNQLPDKCQAVYREKLKRFSAISLRENNAEVIQNLTDTPVEWVVDPTILLGKEQWDVLASARVVKDRYVFCYFLSQDSKERELASKFAEKKGLKLVTIPYVSGNYTESDFKFGDVRIISASPEEWISLIKYADYIFTDSFHGTAFAHIYHKQFFSFASEKQLSERGIRIRTLLELYGTESRFCNLKNEMNVDILLSQPDFNYAETNKAIEKKIKDSYDYLKNNLKQ